MCSIDAEVPLGQKYLIFMDRDKSLKKNGKCPSAIDTGYFKHTKKTLETCAGLALAPVASDGQAG